MKRCWCPCGCGCEEPVMQIDKDGLCPCCKEGNHEIPPSNLVDLPGLLAMYESCVIQLKKYIKEQ